MAQVLDKPVRLKAPVLKGKPRRAVNVIVPTVN